MRPLFENAEIAFYQMNGQVFGTWLKAALEADIQSGPTGGPTPFALAHDVGIKAEVVQLIEALVSARGTCCARRMRRLMAAIAAMSLILMAMHGRSRGIRPDRSTRTAI